MATDIGTIIGNLRSFHDLSGKSVIHVGAGGGQLIGYAVDTRSVLAVDSDPASVSGLETAIRESGWADRFSVVQRPFEALSARADLVFFEFCLHEMDDPDGALHHAQACAPEILVLDHLPDSRWAWHTCEEEKAARSWEAVRRRRVVLDASFKAIQRFESYAELLSRIEVLGERAVIRSRELRECETIEIEMGYSMALIRCEAT